MSVILNGARIQRVKTIKKMEAVTREQENTYDITHVVNVEDSYLGIMDYLEEKERAKVIKEACSIKIVEGARLHPVLVKYKKAMADYRVRLKEAQSKPYYNPRHSKPDGEPAFFTD